VLPVTAVRLKLAELVAKDVAYLAAAAAKNVHLIKEAFTPTPSTDFTTLTEADFDGYAALECPTGNQLYFTDAATQALITQLKEPALGWHWLTTGVTNLPQTIYGYVVTDAADTVTIGSALFSEPITLTGTGQAIDIGVIRFVFATQPMG